MDCKNILLSVEEIKNFTPNEFAEYFVNLMSENINCNKMMEIILYLKENYYEYYVQIMILIGKGS